MSVKTARLSPLVAISRIHPVALRIAVPFQAPCSQPARPKSTDAASEASTLIYGCEGAPRAFSRALAHDPLEMADLDVPLVPPGQGTSMGVSNDQRRHAIPCHEEHSRHWHKNNWEDSLADCANGH
jgi:hypothetical protein